MADGKWQMAKIANSAIIFGVSRRRIIGLILGVCAAGVIVGLLAYDPEPTYKKKTLSEWAEIALVNRGSSIDATEAEEAVRRLGAKELGRLVEWVRGKPKPWKTKLLSAASYWPEALGGRRLRTWAGKDLNPGRTLYAGFTLYCLGPEASPCVPVFRDMIREGNGGELSDRAVDALANIGKTAIPALLDALSERGGPGRERIARLFGDLGTNALPAVPILVGCLRETNVHVVVAAADALGDLKLEPKTVVPALSCGLTNRDHAIRSCSALTLRRFGGVAKSAVPDLVSALDDPYADVRKSAYEALGRIAPEELEKDRVRTHEAPKFGLGEGANR